VENLDMGSKDAATTAASTAVPLATRTAAKTAKSTDGDAVDRMLDIWKRELPELDLATEGIVERIQKLNRYLDRAMNETLTEFNLNRGEWHLLGALRKSGPPYRRSPGHLAEDMGISSGAMTNRLDRLETAGLIRRLPDPADRRSLEVELTDAGWQAWQDTVGTQARKEALVAQALDDGEKERLNDLLRRLMLAFAEVAGPLPRYKEHDSES
jgi:DNA-binding MarR family transcriptional regulator